MYSSLLLKFGYPKKKGGSFCLNLKNSLFPCNQLQEAWCTEQNAAEQVATAQAAWKDVSSQVRNKFLLRLLNSNSF